MWGKRRGGVPDITPDNNRSIEQVLEDAKGKSYRRLIIIGETEDDEQELVYYKHSDMSAYWVLCKLADLLLRR